MNRQAIHTALTVVAVLALANQFFPDVISGRNKFFN